MMETLELYGVHGLPRDTTSPAKEIQEVIHDVGKWKISNRIQSKSAQSYAHRFIQRVKREEEKAEV